MSIPMTSCDVPATREVRQLCLLCCQLLVWVTENRFIYCEYIIRTLRWRQNGRDSVSNHQPHDCLFNRLFRRRSRKTSKLRVTGLCVGKSPGPAQRASYAENVSIWWRHHGNAYLSTMLHLPRWHTGSLVDDSTFYVGKVQYNPLNMHTGFSYVVYCGYHIRN